jgi:hypothetical protein
MPGILTPAILQRRLRAPVTDAVFARFVDQAAGDVREIVESLAAGKIGAPEWAGIMLDALAEAHAQAAFLGRQRAGDRAPFDQDDTRFGQLTAQEEWPFLEGFARDLEAGRYTSFFGSLDVAAIDRRAQMYVARTFGTANEALGLADGGDLWWILGEGPGLVHCSQCPALAAGSPYRPGELHVWPLGNSTPCYQNCRCEIRTASGLRGFSP